MAEMVAPAGTVVTVNAELGAKLARRGWRYTGEVEADPVTGPAADGVEDAESTGEVDADSVKRRPGRPRKAD